MAKTATLNLRVDPVSKQHAEAVLNRLGIPMSTAVDMFLTQITLTGGIPFPVTLPKAPDALNTDLMSIEEVRALIAEGLKDIESGKVQDAASAFAKFTGTHEV